MAVAGAPPSLSAYHAKQVTLEEPWIWLAAGWTDMWRIPQISLTYGVVVTLASYALTAMLFYAEAISLVLPLATGFMLIAPLLAVGLYEASRRLELGLPLPARKIAIVDVQSPAQLAFLGGTLAFALMVWWRLASLLFALFYGLDGFPPIDEWINVLLFTPKGLTFIAIGSAVGGVLAAIVFSISVISVPMLMAEKTDTVTAVCASVKAVRDNLRPMLLWAWLIALLIGFGIATLYVGLIFVFPLVGHATWHAYRSFASQR